MNDNKKENKMICSDYAKSLDEKISKKLKKLGHMDDSIVDHKQIYFETLIDLMNILIREQLCLLCNESPNCVTDGVKEIVQIRQIVNTRLDAEQDVISLCGSKAIF